MAYTNPWDNSAPDGSIVQASDLDQVIKDLKVDITERMDNLVGAGVWANNGIDPKPLLNGYATIFVSASTAAPSVPSATYPEADGYVWYHTDRRVIQIRESAAWEDSGGLSEWVTFGATQAIINSQGLARTIAVIIPVNVLAALGVAGQFTIDMAAFDPLFVGADVKSLIGYGGTNPGDTISPRPVASAGTSFDCVMLTAAGVGVADGPSSVTGIITVDIP